MDTRKAIAILASLVLLVAMPGCSRTDHDDYYYGGMHGAECNAISNNVQQCTMTMTDTRKVTCLVFLPKVGGGISCDWIHASGNDSMEGLQ